MKPPSSLPGPIVLMGFSEDNLTLFAVYEQPRRWWQFWRRPYAVAHFPGVEVT